MKRKTFSYITLIVLCLVSIRTFAQDDMTIYSLNSVPQQYYDNPGLMPVTKYHIGCMPVLFIPILSSNYTSVTNSGFRWDNLMRYDKAKDSLIFDFENTIKKLSKKNYLTLNQQIEWISFGFKIKRTQYVNFSFTEKFKFRLTYPKDLISMAGLGNSQFIGSEANFDGIGIDMTHYREFAIGYTNQIDNKWTVGGRFKLLFGLSNIWTKSSDATLGVDADYYDLSANSNVIIHTAGPEKIYDVIGDTTGSKKFEMVDVKNYMLNFSNPGFGFDVGANYKIDDKWSVSASLIDFGYIFWKQGTRKYASTDKSFTFRGIEINELIRNDTAKIQDILSNLVDSIGKIFTIEQENKLYASPLNPKIYISGSYNISKKDRATAVFRADIYENTIHPAFTLAYNRTFGNILDVAVSYSYMNRDFLNLGLGSSVRFGPFQIFLATDNLLAAIIPYHTKNINVHFGCNYVFYYKPSYPLMKM
ncbi:MAG: DUF5723 family protein [Bacteroidota bacterium]